MVNSSGIISTIAGVGVDGVTLNAAEDVKVDGCGNLFIADANNDRIVEITGLNLVGTVAGISGSAGFSGDGGQAAAAKLYGPVSVAIDSGGNLYISDRVNNRIRKVLN